MLKPHQRMYIIAFLMDCSVMAGFTVVPFFVLRELNGGAAMLGTITALQSVSYAAVSLISAPFVTRAKNGLHWAVVGIVGFAVLFNAAVLVPNAYAYTFISMAGLGCIGLVWPALWSWLGAEPDLATRNRRVSIYNISWSLGLTVGPLASAPLYNTDYRLPFLSVFGLAMTAWLLVLSLPHEKKHFAQTEQTPEQQDRHDAYRRASEAHLYCAWFANLVGWVLVGAARSVFAKRVDELARAGQFFVLPECFGSSTALASAVKGFAALMLLLNFSRLIVFILLGRTSRWQHRFGLLVVSQVAAGLSMWGLAVTHSLVMMVLYCSVIGVNCGITFCVAVAYSLADPSRKHQRLAINEGMVGAGVFVGAMGFGLLAGRYGVAMPFRWGPAIIAVSLIVQWALLRFGIRRSRRAA